MSESFISRQDSFAKIFAKMHNICKKIANEPGHEKTCFMLYANNKDADQPALLRSLISIFIVRCIDSIIPILAKSKISRL